MPKRLSEPVWDGTEDAGQGQTMLNDVLLQGTYLRMELWFSPKKSQNDIFLFDIYIHTVTPSIHHFIFTDETLRK